MPQILEDRILYDHNDWLAGLHPQSGQDRCVLFDGADAMSNVDPLRYLGYLCPGYSPTDATNASVVTTALRNGVINPLTTDTAFAVGGALVHKLNTTTSALYNDGTYPHTVTGATLSDTLSYYVSTVPYVFYSWNDGTDGEVGRLNPADNTFSDAYMSGITGWSALSKDYAHPMIVGQDDKLYIGNGPNLAYYDGQTNTYTPVALALPLGYEIKSFARYYAENALIIFAEKVNSVVSKRGQVTAFFFDYVNADPYRVVNIHGSLCGAGFEYKGTIGLFTGGISLDRTNTTRYVNLCLFNGQYFEVIRSVKESTPPTHGGVDVLGDSIFANVAGKIYSYGSPYAAIDGGLFQIASGGGTTSGMLKFFFTGRLLASTGTGTDGGLEIFNSDFAAGHFDSVFAEVLLPKYRGIRVTDALIEFYDATTGGRQLTVQLYTRDDIGTPKEILVNQATVKVNHWIRDIGFEAKTALKIYLAWAAGDSGTTAPIIRRIHLFYETIND